MAVHAEPHAKSFADAEKLAAALAAEKHVSSDAEDKLAIMKERHAAQMETRDAEIKAGADELAAALQRAAALADSCDSETERLVSLEKSLEECKASKIALNVEVDAKIDAVAEVEEKAAKCERRFGELEPLYEAAAARANALSKQVESLVSEVKALEDENEAFTMSNHFHCADEGETCECPDGDVVYAAKFAEDDSLEDLHGVVASGKYALIAERRRTACGNHRL